MLSKRFVNNNCPHETCSGLSIRQHSWQARVTMWSPVWLIVVLLASPSHCFPAAYSTAPTPDADNGIVISHDNLTAPLTNLSCKVFVAEDDHHTNEQVFAYISQHAKLINYNINVLNYTVNPLLENTTTHYHLNKWSRTASSHGETILSLAFNFDLLSLFTLVSGVEHMNVDIVDEPYGCLGVLTENQKVEVLLDLLLRDLRNNGEVMVKEGENNVCYQVTVRLKRNLFLLVRPKAY